MSQFFTCPVRKIFVPGNTIVPPAATRLHSFLYMLIFQNVENEAELNPHHEDDPIYSPSLKLFLNMGHFITSSIS